MKKLQTRVFTLTLLAAMIFASTYPIFAFAQTQWQAHPMHHIQGDQDNEGGTSDATPGPTGYSPADIAAAYKLSGSGSGTIAIIDAYDDPYVTQDLTALCSQFGLPAPNLEVHKMSSSVSADQGWALEISLDVQWVHAVAPGAKILLVEATSSYLSDLLAAINYAAGRTDVVAVSMSWGGGEFLGESSYDSSFTSSHGTAFFASSGDNGAGASWPSVSANVVSVGGTTLKLTSGTVTSETAWSGSGGGTSVYEPKPAYQNALSGTTKSTPDVSYNADPNTGFSVYDSYGYGGWIVVGGTSAGAPQWAAIQALGGTANNPNFYADYAQSYSAHFRDITQGSNGYPAKTGYDLATGLGSPITVNYAAPPTPDFAITASPTQVSINAGSQGTSTITITPQNGFTGAVTLTATQLTGWTQPTLTPNSITTSGTSTLTITVPTTASAGTYQVTVAGTSATNSHSTTISVQVTKPDFSIAASPTSLTITRGSTGHAAISVSPLNGYTGTVTLTASTIRGITCTFSPQSLNSGNSAMTITVSSSTARGTYTITVTGKDTAGLTHTTQIRVTAR